MAVTEGKRIGVRSARAICDVAHNHLPNLTGENAGNNIQESPPAREDVVHPVLAITEQTELLSCPTKAIANSFRQIPSEENNANNYRSRTKRHRPTKEGRDGNLNPNFINNLKVQSWMKGNDDVVGKANSGDMSLVNPDSNILLHSTPREENRIEWVIERRPDGSRCLRETSTVRPSSHIPGFDGGHGTDATRPTLDDILPIDEVDEIKDFNRDLITKSHDDDTEGVKKKERRDRPTLDDLIPIDEEDESKDFNRDLITKSHDMEGVKKEERRHRPTLDDLLPIDEVDKIKDFNRGITMKSRDTVERAEKEVSMSINERSKDFNRDLNTKTRDTEGAEKKESRHRGELRRNMRTDGNKAEENCRVEARTSQRHAARVVPERHNKEPSGEYRLTTACKPRRLRVNYFNR